MMVNIHTDSPLIFGGTEEPAANGTLHSIGAIGGEKNKAITKAIQDIVTAKLGVPNDRFYLAVSGPLLASVPCLSMRKLFKFAASGQLIRPQLNMHAAYVSLHLCTLRFT